MERGKFTADKDKHTSRRSVPVIASRSLKAGYMAARAHGETKHDWRTLGQKEEGCALAWWKHHARLSAMPDALDGARHTCRLKHKAPLRPRRTQKAFR
eukprot:scaffold257548_cov28-Tisochrysis_lutea.AAC.2